QSPNLEPTQLKPPVAPYKFPHLALVETLTVGAVYGPLEVGAGTLEDTGSVLRAGEGAAELLQVPNRGLHPSEQYAEVRPQNPY
ncbi:hypothetical protein CC86DRAFT_257226, partial [Ophiobolus disseminans]